MDKDKLNELKKQFQKEYRHFNCLTTPGGINGVGISADDTIHVLIENSQEVFDSIPNEYHGAKIKKSIIGEIIPHET